MKKLLVILMLVGLVLGGCANTGTMSGATPQIQNSFVYPRNNQDQAQMDVDKQECMGWANTQRPYPNDAQKMLLEIVGGSGTVNSYLGEFERAYRTCMDAKGYSVR